MDWLYIQKDLIQVMEITKWKWWWIVYLRMWFYTVILNFDDTEKKLTKESVDVFIDWLIHDEDIWYIWHSIFYWWRNEDF